MHARCAAQWHLALASFCCASSYGRQLLEPCVLFELIETNTHAGGTYVQALPNKRVLIMCHENITINHYAGNNRSCLVSNCLFRVGGAACIMSNRYDSCCDSHYEA